MHVKHDVIQLPFDVELLPVTPLKAGNLTCLYERGNLRCIKWGAVEIVRMIYGAVRDGDWATAPYKIENEKLEVADEKFHISYTAFYEFHAIRYKAFFTIRGNQNRIDVSMTGEALSDFERNRIGLCVHHPIAGCAGETVQIERPQGTLYESVFPVPIAPHQPFREIKNMHWNMAGGLDCSLHFEGDVFETEDQRNWTDCSYKTYGTPLALPRPVPVKKGETMAQRLTLTVASAAPKTAVLKQQSASHPRNHTFPKIGYARPSGSAHLPDAAMALLRQVPFHHYHVEIHFNQHWKTELKTALSEARQLAAKLTIVLFFYDDHMKDLQAFLTLMEPQRDMIANVLPLDAATKTTTPALFQAVHGHLKKFHGSIKIGWGTDGFFAELNRNRPQMEGPDFVSFSLNPQVHLSDTRSLLENLEAQQDTIQTIKTFSGKPIHIAPVTFKIRNAENPCGSDARQHTAFGAYWTLAAVAGLAEADAIILHQTVGPCGLLRAKTEADASGFYEQTPLYNLLVELKKFAPVRLFHDAAARTVGLENERGNQLVYKLSG